MVRGTRNVDIAPESVRRRMASGRHRRRDPRWPHHGRAERDGAAAPRQALARDGERDPAAGRRVLAKERSEAARPACDEGASRKPGGVGGAAPHVEETDQDWAGQAIAPARIGVRSGLIPESAPNPAPDPQSAPDPGAAALASAPGNVGRCRAVTGWRRERWP